MLELAFVHRRSHRSFPRYSISFFNWSCWLLEEEGDPGHDKCRAYLARAAACGDKDAYFNIGNLLTRRARDTRDRAARQEIYQTALEALQKSYDASQLNSIGMLLLPDFESIIPQAFRKQIVLLGASLGVENALDALIRLPCDPTGLAILQRKLAQLRTGHLWKIQSEALIELLPEPL
jgi:hypothetical protein